MALRGYPAHPLFKYNEQNIAAELKLSGKNLVDRPVCQPNFSRRAKVLQLGKTVVWLVAIYIYHIQYFSHMWTSQMQKVGCSNPRQTRVNSMHSLLNSCKR